jgi:hypothetical protein
MKSRFQSLLLKSQLIRISVSIITSISILVMLSLPARAFDIKNLPIITPAENFVERPKQFSIGEDLEFTVKQTVSAMKYRKSDFQIRVFRLPDKVSQKPIPKAWNKIDDCLIFISNVFAVKGANSETIRIVKLDDKWLTPDADISKSMKPGRFILVFEKINDSGNIFRLKESSVSEYFESGVVIVVDPIRSYAIDEIQGRQTKLTTAQNSSKQQIAQNGQLLPCYRFKPLAISEKEQENADEFPVTLCLSEPYDLIGASDSSVSQ